MRQAFLALEAELNEVSLEREDLVRGLLLALLTREHCFVLGPPGADKSRLISALMARIEGATAFTLLLTRFSTPEEVLGPVSLPALEHGVFARMIEGHLPEAQVAFLDEIFKANAAILNALLMLTNERLYRNAGRLHAAPLVSLFAASNELPAADELGPLYDRLLLRYEIGYLAEERNVARLLQPTGASRGLTAKLRLDELEAAQVEVARVRVPDEVVALMLRLRASLKAAGLSVSDRRFKAALSVAKAQAWLSGHAQVQADDLEVLAHVLWTEPKDRRLVTDRVLQHASPMTARALELRDLAAEQYRVALEKRAGKSEAETAEAMTKLKGLVEALVNLRRDVAQRGPVSARIERALEEVQGFRRQVLRECLGVEV